MNARTITAADESEAAIYAEGTKYTKAVIIRAYREHLDAAGEPLDIQRFCETVLGIGGHTYRIAFATEAGGWDVVDTFTAADDDAANTYAEEHYAGQDWYVLDAAGRNINGGRDQN